MHTRPKVSPQTTRFRVLWLMGGQCGLPNDEGEPQPWGLDLGPGPLVPQPYPRNYWPDGCVRSHWLLEMIIDLQSIRGNLEAAGCSGKATSWGKCVRCLPHFTQWLLVVEGATMKFSMIRALVWDGGILVHTPLSDNIYPQWNNHWMYQPMRMGSRP